MGNPSLIAKLGIDESDFARGLQASEERLQETQDKAKLLAAELALLQQKMANGKTDEMVAQHGRLQTALRETRAEAKEMASQLAALNALKPPTVAASTPVPDESTRYEAHWRKLEEQERSRRAHEAMGQSLAPAPAARPVKVELARDEKALVGEAPEVILGRLFSPSKAGGQRSPASGASAEGESEGSHGGKGNTRMRDAELAHSGRSLVDMMMAGQNPLQALQMEAPRLIQAFGGGLGQILGVGVAVAGIGALVSKTIELTQQARALKKGFAEAMAEPTRGVQSVESLSEHVKMLDAQIKEDPAKGGFFSRITQKIKDRITSSGEDLADGDFNPLGTGSHNARKERNDRVGREEKERADQLG